MTCGACAARIERRLNRLDGVAATVNYATGRAYFASTGGRGPAELIGVIESAGYTAEPPASPSPDSQQQDPQTRALARRLAVCGPLAVAVIVLSMVPAAQFPGWQWVSLLLAAPVATWGAWPLYRAAWYGLGHGAATMDTLVSVGVGASFCWSVYALLFGGAGATGMKMSFAFTFGQAGADTLYLEAAAGVTAAVLAGRYLEARARDRSGLALSALAAWAPRPSRCCATEPSTGSRPGNSRPGTCSWSDRGRRSPPTGSWPRAVRRLTRRWSPASRCPPRSARATR